jgi:acetylglutamate kinase
MSEEYIKKAETLLEALPYMRSFQGQTLVIKYGGAAMIEPELKRAFAQDITLLQYLGIHPVVVHGGGPQIGKMLEEMKIPTRFVDGHRVTDESTMDVVEMVLAGKINKEIVNLINTAGGRAVGLSGKDGQLLMAQKMEFYRPREDEPPEIIDIGLVGEVTAVNTDLIRTLESRHFIPVIAPVGVGELGETYNINADLVAGAVAAALDAAKLILLTDVPGVLDREGRLISSLTRRQAVALMEEDVIVGGMLPKIKCCLEALDEGVAKAHILDGRSLHAVLLEIFTDTGIGTEIVG